MSVLEKVIGNASVEKTEKPSNKADDSNPAATYKPANGTAVEGKKQASKLFAKRKIFPFSNKLTVSTTRGSKKCQINKNKFFSSLETMSGKEIGRVELLMQHKLNIVKTKIYKLSVETSTIGFVTQESTAKISLHFTFNNWRLDSDVSGCHFDVYDAEKNVVLEIDDAFPKEGTYVLTFFKKENEIIGLLTLMLVDFIKNQQH